LSKVVIAGCGFLGEAAAFLFLAKGWKVLGLCASEESASRFENSPLDVRAMDITLPMVIPQEWKAPDVLIHCASSSRGGAEEYRKIYLEGLKNVMSSFEPQRVIFTSSTSVFGQTDGLLVDEDCPAQPERETGRILLEAEAVALESGGCVARLSGIYGPGRSMLLKKILGGTAVLEDGGSRWINQIHRDDGGSALLHLAQASTAHGLYNVSDNTPATQREVYGWITAYLDLPLPPEGPSDPNRKRGLTSKRVSNARLRAAGWAPRYPSFRDALPGLIGT